jgi:lipopolysaccharide/colanic/teichoic acid biosynthesis glycosyltransferase/GGDEF domain-containing protein
MFNFKSNNPDIDMKTGFYNRCFFDMRLCEERRRTERSGSPFSLFSMDISDLGNLTKKHPNLNFLQIKKTISDIVRENCRTCDTKTWYSETTLIILLPDTSMTDAQVFSEKLQNKFNNGLRSSFGLEDTFNLNNNMMITSFPEMIKNSESILEGNTKPFDKPKATSLLKSSIEENTSKRLTMKRAPMDQTSLTWPLYSDLLMEHDILNIEKWIKRGTDIVGSLFLIILLSPVMFVIAILIKITSRGPVLFKQERIGYLGIKFTFLKFRSMYAGCDERSHKEYVKNLIKNNCNNTNCSSEGRPVFKMEHDPRISPFGRLLRKSSLDELPQLINVFKGEMSLVGPRPPIAYEVANYECWHLRRVLEVKPGITGLWQIHGRSRTTFDEMVRLDIAYVNNWSLWLDLKILFKTIWVVLSAKGAY